MLPSTRHFCQDADYSSSWVKNTGRCEKLVGPKRYSTGGVFACSEGDTGPNLKSGRAYILARENLLTQYIFFVETRYT